MIQKKVVFILLLSSFFLAGMDYPPNGTDYDAYRCSGGLVSIDDPMPDILAKCGEPLREEQPDIQQPGSVLVYRFDQSQVYYFEFLDNRLSRIYAVDCLQNDPDCK